MWNYIRAGEYHFREFAEQKPDQDILVRLVIKKTSGCFSYASVRNQSTDFPVIACAASVVGGEYRLSVGARPGRAMLLLDEEGLLSEGLTEDSIENLLCGQRNIFRQEAIIEPEQSIVPD